MATGSSESPSRSENQDLVGKTLGARYEVQRELKLVPLHGPSLARLGTTTEVASISDYALSQAWSHALW